MKVLVTGIGGQLGYDVMKVLHHRNIDCLGADLAEFDITDFVATEKFIKEYNLKYPLSLSSLSNVRVSS